MEVNSELNPTAQAMAKAQEQLHIAMEVQHWGVKQQLWAEETVKTWQDSASSVAISDKVVAEEASERAVERVARKKMQKRWQRRQQKNFGSDRSR